MDLFRGAPLADMADRYSGWIDEQKDEPSIERQPGQFEQNSSLPGAGQRIPQQSRAQRDVRNESSRTLSTDGESILPVFECFEFLSYRMLGEFLNLELPDLRHRIRSLRMSGFVVSHPLAIRGEKFWRITDHGLARLGSKVEVVEHVSIEALRDITFAADLAAGIHSLLAPEERLLTRRQIMTGAPVGSALRASSFRIRVVLSEADPYASSYDLCPDMVIAKDVGSGAPRCQAYVFESTQKQYLRAYRTMVRSYSQAPHVDKLVYVSPDANARAVVREAADRERVGGFVTCMGYSPSEAVGFTLDPA